METITYTSARNNLAKTMERVCDTHSPVIIPHEPDNSVIMISLEDFQALEETVYLLRSPANACRLLESITELNTGKGLEKRLVE